MKQFRMRDLNLSIEKSGDPKRVWIPSLVFLVFALLFVRLRSNDFFTVDGAFRCFEVYHRRHILFDGTNHLLYLIDVFTWAHFASWMGFNVDAPREYFSTVEVMNCLAGAGCLAIFCYLLYVVTSSWLQALSGTIGYGLCKAFIAQATNANQPMLGIFWSFLALLFAVLSFKRKSVWPLCVSGLLFALAMATYSSTIFLAFVVVALVFIGRLGSSERFEGNLHRFIKLAVFAFSGFVGSIAIFALAYSHMSIEGPGAMLRHFFWPPEAHVYWHISIGKFLNVPVGMLRNTFPILTSYNGIRGLIARRDSTSLAFLLSGSTFCGFLLFLVVQVWKRRAHLEPSQTIGLMSAAAGFVFTMIPTVLHDPEYDKLWIQPLACLTVFVVVALSVIARDSKKSFFFSITVSIILMAGVAANLVWVAQAHVWEPYQLNEAQRLSAILDKRDLMVGGWDEVSVLYGSLLADEDRYFSFPTEAMVSGAASESRLRKIISETRQIGGRIYFLSILDQPKAAWDSYLGSRCGVPYDALDVYRRGSQIRESFKTRSGEIFLREFNPGSLN